MSASPAGHTPGRTTNGDPLPPRRRPPKVNNVLVQKKKPQRPRPAAPNPGGKGAANGSSAPALRPAPAKKEPRDLQVLPFGDTNPSLFTKPPPPGSYTDFPIVMTKRALMEGLRHHVARFSSRKPIDPRDQSEFQRPLFLLRRDVRAPMPGTEEWEEMKAEAVKREQEGAGDAERTAAKEAARAEIAPSLQKKKAKPQKKKANEAVTRNNLPESKAKSQLKYEEALPWHLEDDEQNKIWMGTYEDASSNIWSQLKYEDTPSGPRYVMTPLQKWYKFLPKTRLNSQQTKMAEARKIKKEKASPEPGFLSAFVKAEQQEAWQQEDERNAMNTGGKSFFRGVLANERGGAALHDDIGLDFEEDFADDEAPAAIEGEEEDVKAIEARIKKDQLNSNVFGNKSMKEYEDEQELEAQLGKLLRKHGRKTQKALFKRERNAIYEYNKENPYSDESDSTDTEAELEREKERKEAEAKAVAAAAAAATGGVKIKSEPGSRNNTPGHRPSKHADPLHRAAQNLKRPGSPNLSDASGNESTAARKKAKFKNPTSRLVSNMPSRTQSPAPAANGGPSVAGSNRSFGAGSGSDTEGGGPRRLKLSSPRSPAGSPGQSRTASRAGSPAPSVQAKLKDFPKTPEELRPHIPEEGITMAALVGKFANVESANQQRGEIIRMVKLIAKYDKQTKLLTPKPR